MEIVRDEEYGGRILWVTFREFGIMFCGWLLIALDFGRFDLGFWIGVAGFFLGSLLAGHRIKRSTRHYVCPRCHSSLPRRPGSWVRFYCKNCDVEYQTQVHDEG